jgi:putative transposase
MARFARVVVPGLSYHVTHRGNRRADIFLSDEDRLLYLKLMRDYAVRAGLEFRAWCLMSSHVHFVVVAEREDSLSRGIGLAHRRFAAWLNARHGWLGHLWANRFFSTPLDETHLWRAVRYVERNPVRAGLVARAEEWPWSSARSRVEGSPDPLLAPGWPEPQRLAGWSEWLAEPDDGELVERLRRCTQTGRPCGFPDFVTALESALNRALAPRKRGPKPRPRSNATADGDGENARSQ